MQDSERVDKLCLKFLILYGLDIFFSELNFVIIDVAFRLHIFIMSRSLKFGDMVEVLLALNYQFSKLSS